MKPSVYIETTVVGHLTSRLPSDPRVAGQMLETRKWWEKSRHEFEVVTSELVREEASRGGIREDVARLRLRQRRIHRHADRPVHEQREIREQPSGPALGHDGNPIAGLHAERAQPERQVPQPLEPFLRGVGNRRRVPHRETYGHEVFGRRARLRRRGQERR